MRNLAQSRCPPSLDRRHAVTPSRRHAVTPSRRHAVMVSRRSASRWSHSTARPRAQPPPCCRQPPPPPTCPHPASTSTPPCRLSHPSPRSSRSTWGAHTRLELNEDHGQSATPACAEEGSAPPGATSSTPSDEAGSHPHERPALQPFARSLGPQMAASQLAGLAVSPRVPPAAARCAEIVSGSCCTPRADSGGFEGFGLCRLCEKRVPMEAMKEHLHICTTHIRAYHGEEVRHPIMSSAAPSCHQRAYHGEEVRHPTLAASFQCRMPRAVVRCVTPRRHAPSYAASLHAARYATRRKARPSHASPCATPPTHHTLSRSLGGA